MVNKENNTVYDGYYERRYESQARTEASAEVSRAQNISQDWIDVITLKTCWKYM
jgi:hypothetical protein